MNIVVFISIIFLQSVRGDFNYLFYSYNCFCVMLKYTLMPLFVSERLYSHVYTETWHVCIDIYTYIYIYVCVCVCVCVCAVLCVYECGMCMLGIYFDFECNCIYKCLHDSLCCCIYGVCVVCGITRAYVCACMGVSVCMFCRVCVWHCVALCTRIVYFTFIKFFF